MTDCSLPLSSANRFPTAASHRSCKSSLLTLPDELIQHICTFLPIQSLITLEHVCRRLHIQSSSPVLWRSLCVSKYKYWEPRHDLQTKLRHCIASEVDWKGIYKERARTDKRVNELLDGLINQSTNRITRFEGIADVGYDAKDCLKENLEVFVDAEDALARRYYANETLSFIHRKKAIEIWKRVGAGEEQVSLEEALGAYDLFITKGATRDIEQISTSLNELADNFRNENPDYIQLSRRDLSKALIIFLREEGFSGVPYVNYGDAKNNFLGICVDSNRATLPITTVIIFCAVAARIDLCAIPCALINHVIAIVPLDDGRYTYWDPFQHQFEMSYEAVASIYHLGPPVATRLHPTPTRDLVVRAARNILESVRQSNSQLASNWYHVSDLETPPVTIDRYSALYAAFTASVLCGPSASTHLLESLCVLMQREYSMDVGFFEKDMFRIISDDDALTLKNICKAVRAEDQTPKRPIRRNLNSEVKHCIGTVFRHRRYHYTAVIIGWTETCNTGEDWIRQMGVEQLTRGRNQPFYNTLVADGSVRYVAEDNIQMTTSPDTGRRLEGFLNVGKYFRKFDRQRGCFVSNIRDEYPDD